MRPIRAENNKRKSVTFVLVAVLVIAIVAFLVESPSAL